MLPREAHWFGRRLREFPEEALYPMLNIGSHTTEFRTREQPWIDRHLFAEARKKGLSITHTDIRPDDGVDLVGDLTDSQFIDNVRSRQFRSVVCTNLLEHLPNREVIAYAVTQCVVPGGYLLISVPHIFPYHPDPIDTMYRPNVAELASVFPGTSIIRGEELPCGTLVHFMLNKLLADPLALFRNLYRRKKQVVQQTEQGLSARQWVPWLWTTFITTCLILKRDEAGK
jgi:hypothetical protein